jgi:hypothetical protein
MPAKTQRPYTSAKELGAKFDKANKKPYKLHRAYAHGVAQGRVGEVLVMLTSPDCLAILSNGNVMSFGPDTPNKAIDLDLLLEAVQALIKERAMLQQDEDQYEAEYDAWRKRRNDYINSGGDDTLLHPVEPKRSF